MVLETDQDSCGPNRRWWRRPSRGDITPANIAKVAVEVLALLLAGNWMLVTLMIYLLALSGAFWGLQQLGDRGLENGYLLSLPLIIWAAVWMVLGYVPMMAAVTWMLRWGQTQTLGGATSTGFVGRPHNARNWIDGCGRLPGEPCDFKSGWGGSASPASC